MVISTVPHRLLTMETNSLSIIIDDYDLVQHILLTNGDILDLVITKQHYPVTASTEDYDVGFLDHFMVSITLSFAKLHLSCSIFEAHNIKAMDMN